MEWGKATTVINFMLTNNIGRCIISAKIKKGEMKMPIPNDPMILLSYINTQLRDFYPSLEEFGKTNNVDIEAIKKKLFGIGYEYNSAINRFV